MALPQRARGVKVLKAVSSPLRLSLLNLLYDKGALSYSELMSALKMSPSRDAGKFAYHLKFLLKANLVEVDAEAKKYYLTDLGKMVIDVADRVEKKAHKPRGMMVRTSHYTVEEFDANKIANALIKEAKMPAELAEKTAKEAEKILLKAKIKYLTAPLIREVVNSILIQRGLEEYRHKLTRLGMPVHEVAALIDTKDSDALITYAGKTVLAEYTLLNVYPRDIADAQLSGAMYIDDVGTWILKPKEVIHDLRFFFQHGIRTSNTAKSTIKPPQNFESALSTIFNVLLYTNSEITGTQTCEYFNVFLAPFARGTPKEELKEQLRLFILNLNQHTDTTLCIEPVLPKFLTEKPAIGPQGKTCGSYEDFADEVQLLATLLLEIATEESTLKPLFNPKIIVKLVKEAFTNEKANQILLQAHNVTSQKGIIYFASKLQDGNQTTFSASGCRFEPDLTGDWETDTLRTGCIGQVTINLPRIIYESEKDKNKLLEILRERWEMAARTLTIGHRALKQHGKNTFPFITQNSNGDTYFRTETCASIINLAGLQECTESFTGKPANCEENINFMEEIAQNISTFKQKIGRKYGKRLFTAVVPSYEASTRLAELDIEKYGVAKVKFSGTRDKPFYTTSRRMQVQTGNFLYVPTDTLKTEQKLKTIRTGASLTIIELEDKPYAAEALLNLTRQLVENRTVEFFTYNHRVTYCGNCKKSWYGILQKCPSCSTISTLVNYDRFNLT